MTTSGRRNKVVDLENPDGEPIADGDGGYDQPYKTFATGIFVSIEPATARGLERFRSNTVISTASHLVTMPFIAGVSTLSQLKYNGRTLKVRGYADPNESGIELILACEEIVK
jgi:head-tail adaptor